MDKILFLSEFTEQASDIYEQMIKTFDAKNLSFDLKEARKYIAQEKPIAVVAYVKELSYEAEHTLRLLLQVENIPYILIGSKGECHDFFNNPYIKRYIITPVTIKDIISRIQETIDAIEGRISKEEFEQQRKEKEKMGKQKHILLIDDDVVALRTVMNYLKEDYKVSVVKSGTAGISFLGKEIPDLILLDYEMPVCDGVQTLKLIRSEQDFKDIPVFFLTGVDSSEQVKAAVELKPEGYILKSTPKEQILEKIKSFFDNKK